MSVKDVAVGAISFGLGVAVGKMPIKLPNDVEGALGRLRFVDAKETVILTAPHIYGYGVEGDWQVWLLGYGLSNSLPNDVMVDVGKHPTMGIHVTIMKGSHNPIEVWFDGLLVTTFPEISTQKTPYSGSIWIKIEEQLLI